MERLENNNFKSRNCVTKDKKKALKNRKKAWVLYEEMESIIKDVFMPYNIRSQENLSDYKKTHNKKW